MIDYYEPTTTIIIDPRLVNLLLSLLIILILTAIVIYFFKRRFDTILRHLVFQHKRKRPQTLALTLTSPNLIVFLVRSPLRILGRLNKPARYGLKKVHNFYLPTEKNIVVGVWHYIPLQLDYDPQKDRYNTTEQHFERYFRSNDPGLRPCVIYVHGSTQDR